jgi:arsenate reductase-like glutaredoxin family protein
MQAWPNRFYTRTPTERPARNARTSRNPKKTDGEQIHINKTPPAREFLEEHIDENDYLDFVSARSPVFKSRPLPTSKKEAIDLMMENPNLIRRPILVRGSKVTFGFDKDAYSK